MHSESALPSSHPPDDYSLCFVFDWQRSTCDVDVLLRQGGLEFFTTQIESAEGDLELLQAAMDAANKEVDPADEEAKGGSGEVGKVRQIIDFPESLA